MHDMLRLVMKKRAMFESGKRTLEVSLGTLHVLNRVYLQDLSHPLAVEFPNIKLPSAKDLAAAKDVIASIPALAVLGGPRVEKVHPVDLSLFQNITRLRLERVKPYLIENMTTLSESLVYAKVTNALASGDELLDIEGSSDKTWKELNTLDLSDNFMVDIHPLTGTLHSVTNLDLSNNMIAQIKCLQGCYALTRLCLSGNQIRDLKGASTELGCIRILELRGNNIKSLDGLEGLLGLEELDLGENKIDDFTEVFKLGTLPLLSSLRLDGNEIAKRKTYRKDVFSVFIKQFTAETTTSTFRLDGLAPTAEELRIIEASAPKIYNPVISFSSRAVAHGMDGNNTVSQGAVITPVALAGKGTCPKGMKRKKKTKMVEIDSSPGDAISDPFHSDPSQSDLSSAAQTEKKAEVWMEKINDLKEKFGKKWLIGVNELMGEDLIEDNNVNNNCDDMKVPEQADNEEADTTTKEEDTTKKDNLAASKDFVENGSSVDDYSSLLAPTANDDDSNEGAQNEENASEIETARGGPKMSAASEYSNGSTAVSDYSSLFAPNPDIDSASGDEGRCSLQSSGLNNEVPLEAGAGTEATDYGTKSSPLSHKRTTEEEEYFFSELDKKICETHEDPLFDELNISLREDVDMASWLALKVFPDSSDEASLFTMDCVSCRTKTPVLLVISNESLYVVLSDSQKPILGFKEWITRKSTITSCPIQDISHIVVGPWYQYVCIEGIGMPRTCFLTLSHTKTHYLVDSIAQERKTSSIPLKIVHTAKETRLNFTANIVRSKVNKTPPPATVLMYAQVFHIEKKAFRTLVLTPARLVLCKEDIGKWPLPKSQFTREKEAFILELITVSPSSEPPWTLTFTEERESWSVAFGDKEGMLLALRAINYAFFQRTKTYVSSWI